MERQLSGSAEIDHSEAEFSTPLIYKEAAYLHNDNNSCIASVHTVPASSNLNRVSTVVRIFVRAILA